MKQENNKNWYSMRVQPKNEASSDLEIRIYDEIGLFGVSAETFTQEFNKVKDLGGNITLKVNSPGGDVFDGMTIYNILKTVKDRLTVEVEGLSASIASVISMAGSKLVMREGSFLMIHNPFMGAFGESVELRKAADMLDKVKEELVSIYVNNSNLSKEEIESMMDDETWMNAREALEAGIADEIDEEYLAAAAKWDANKYFNKAPIIKEEKTDNKEIIRKLDAKLLTAKIKNKR